MHIIRIFPFDDEKNKKQPNLLEIEVDLFSFDYGNKIFLFGCTLEIKSRNIVAQLQYNIPLPKVIKTVHLLGNNIVYITIMHHDTYPKNFTKKKGDELLDASRFLCI